LKENILENSSAVEDILGYAICTASVNELVNKILLGFTSSVRCSWLACLNAHSYAVTLEDADFTKALKSCDWLVPDGAGMVLASRILGGKIRQRITGSDIFYALNARLNELGGYSVFFLGSSEACLVDIRNRMARDYPGIRFAGCYSPPFKPVYTENELELMMQAVNNSNADVLWVGMTAPKQEKWLYQHSGQLNVKFAAAIGAVFDFYTGRVTRAHPVLQRLGLEWLSRFMQEPRRLFKRTFVSIPVFLLKLFKHRMFR
jgi:N-acetylglucosaminyldiphosphoundecaprenol N-acetyl-beta-D-mannosaminyltransferase